MRKEKKTIEATLKVCLPFTEKKIAESICKATSPENKETPDGVIATSKLEKSSIYFTVQATASFWDIIATTEDFFEKVALSLKTIESLK